MGSMDRNTIIGFVLLAVLLFLYLFLSTKSSQELQLVKKRTEDSLALVQRAAEAARIASDTAAPVIADTNSLERAIIGKEEFTVLENDLIKVTFTNKGGQPASVELKGFNSSHSGQPVVLGGTDYDKFSYAINTGANQAAQISELYFSPAETKTAGGQGINYTLSSPGGESITHQFSLPDGQYMLDWTIQLNGADRLLTEGALNFIWQNQPLQQEKDIRYERQMTNICFFEDNDFDYIQSKNAYAFESTVNWVSVAQQFFNVTLIAKNPFTSGNVSWVKDENDTSAIIAKTSANFQSKLPLGSVATIPLQLYYGPNDYAILKGQAPEMDKIVNLGRDFYAFVRPINKYIVRPIFNFFDGFTASMGLVIALLTIFIRLVTSPLVYSSYLSGARMKALRPEIEAMKKRVGNDQQQVGMEQMKLFREAGVNPLGGCIPALLQIPIFFALYSFFNSNIDLRGESFLWAEDLSTYDVILRFPVYIWGLGDHLSLFTLTAAVTSLLISLYNINMTPDQSNPMLKYMPFIFPFVLLFIFNSLPSALTWYYTVSNLITLILQFIIQNYIIDHKKILARIEENKKKPKVKSKWQERFEQIQEQQRQLNDAKTKGAKKK